MSQFKSWPEFLPPAFDPSSPGHFRYLKIQSLDGSSVSVCLPLTYILKHSKFRKLAFGYIQSVNTDLKTLYAWVGIVSLQVKSLPGMAMLHVGVPTQGPVTPVPNILSANAA